MPSTTPLISLIVAVYGVEEYLSDFLSSLDGQDLSDVEIVFIDDGSPDASHALITRWLESKAGTMRSGHLVRQENGGASSARNAGLAIATGEWLSFPDPDDILASDYLSQVRSALQGADDSLSLVATPLIMFNESDGTYRNSHPLRGMFNGGPRRLHLLDSPAALKISGATSFLRHAVLRAQDLNFDTELRPNFEDADLVTRYLAVFDDPVVQTLPSAYYYYRTRSDASSLVSSSWSKPEKYLTVPTRGWLRLAEDIAAKRGSLPRFVQNVLLYDMSWYFSADARIHTPTKGLTDEVCGAFLDSVKRVLVYIDDEAISEYVISYLSTEVRVGLLALRGADLSQFPVTLWRIDETRGLAQVKYYTTRSDSADEQFVSQGTPVEPVWSKYRGIRYFRSNLVHERIVWIPFHEGMTVSVDGVARRFQLATDAAASWTLSPALARRVGFRGSYSQRALQLNSQSSRRARLVASFRRRQTQARRILQGNSPRFFRVWDRLTRLIATRTNRYADAWVFMDRDTQAQDNAEHLYRWVSEHKPEINSWFVISKKSSDWSRLRKEGFRVVAFGSWQHTLLLLRAKHLASSHIDKYVVQPLHPKRFPGRSWNYTFLQHGVTKDDISRWLNPKPIRRIISVGPDEQEAFVGNGSPYVFTERESALTGFPRHDALLRLASMAPAERPYILVIPTWREYLLGPATGKGNSRELAPGFEESEYVRAWTTLLQSEALRLAAAEAGKQIIFVSHPNLEPHIGRLQLPDHVTVKTYATTNIQSLIANGSLLVTDYSSIAFDSAFIGTPAVYFQFDREAFFADHPHRPGYFSYGTDGFGPVTTDVSATVDSVAAAITQRGSEWEEYRARAKRFFAFRDQGACERVFTSMMSIDAT
ncbi:CDP-glycerol glycerophosphotransferase family protein [Microbacterium sp. KUDC0406]|uniref:bifunctional glycosyltransferase/CDP-glycerol:glycerophosphate glycerophosphotransferase n=1 Tax=Microbacterium sp. KUDC0406 TaxID=2909588 RepID=UPI001F2FF4AB|nr:CDP-glycerol glycerophosphotransferase family protein [Microbacterium sp. KUDC0406]UJP09725.1 CDP-glycerol glycerophosphotransferase family protein [Microbacterium sp. KUDC0406]